MTISYRAYELLLEEEAAMVEVVRQDPCPPGQCECPAFSRPRRPRVVVSLDPADWGADMVNETVEV